MRLSGYIQTNFLVFFSVFIISCGGASDGESSSSGNSSSMAASSSEASSSSSAASSLSSSVASSSSSESPSVDPAYEVPTRIQAQDYSAFGEEDSNRSGDSDGVCSFGLVDLAETSDNEGICTVGWTLPGEWLSYNISTNSDGEFDLVLRLSSAMQEKQVQVSIDGVIVGLVEGPGLDWGNYKNKIIPKVFLSAGVHTVQVTFLSGGVNFNYMEFMEHNPALVPARIQAQHYDDFGGEDNDRKGESSGPCSEGLVDLDTTVDNGGECAVAWTLSDEWVAYDVYVLEQGEFGLNLRMSANLPNKRVSVSIDGAEFDTVTVPANGWDNYTSIQLPKIDLTQGFHTLRISFIDGGVNLNYFDLSHYQPPVEMPAPGEAECTLDRAAEGIPEITLFTVFSKSVSRADFCLAEPWYSESPGKQVFRLLEGDNYADHVDGGRVHARTEAQHGLRFTEGESWHEFEARMLPSNKLGYTFTIAQLFAGCCGPEARVEVKNNGRIHVGSTIQGNIRISDDKDYIALHESFKIKIRSNGREVEVYFNGELKYKDRTKESTNGNTDALYHFRWGVYSNEILPTNISNTVTEIRRF